MEFSLDMPWPWSLSPVEALQLLTRGLLPTLLSRTAVAGLAALFALPAWRGRAISRYAAAGFAALLGWLLARQPMLVLAAVFVVYFTVATYRGSARARGGRLLVLVGLRLFALLLTALTIARPALGFRSDNRVPSMLIIAFDKSKSMTYKDEFNDQTRDEAVRAQFKKCETILKDLREDHQVTVVMLRFHADVADFDADAAADGMRSDYGLLVNTVYERFGSEPNLRGLLIVGDGADNGLRFDALLEAQKFRAIQCPINGFAVGSDTTNSTQKDIAITAVTVEPTPVYVKGRMTLRATVNAVGFEQRAVRANLFVDGKEVPIERMAVNKEPVEGGSPAFPLSMRNELIVEASAPQLPGEVRVTLKLQVLPGEVSIANNEISTYVSVIKEGVSVLLVDDLREERKYLQEALQSDPRFRLFQAVRQTEAPPAAEEAELFNLDRQAYDVIILGNVSAKRLSAGNPKILQKIRDLVEKNGVGFMMIGGHDSFGGSPEDPRSGDWKGTPIADLLPVQLDVAGHLKPGEQPLGLYPTAKGKEHFLLQIAATPGASDKAWEKLNQNPFTRPTGMNRISRAKAGGAGKLGAEVLATTQPNGQGDVVMAAQGAGRGRTLAFAMDTTNLWTKLGLNDETYEGVKLHARFWKQTVLWLAQQENSEGSVWVKPDFRRVGSGAKQAFSAGVKGKSGMDLPGGRYEAKVIAPNGASYVVPVSREGTVDRGTFWKTDLPGEYRIEVTGAARDVDGKPVTGKASVRFLAYQDESELMDQAAKSEYLGNLAYAGGGRKQAYRLDELGQFLKDLKSAKLPNSRVKTKYWPEWRKPGLALHLPLLVTLFLVLFGLEWGLRRWWGMV